MSGYLKKRSKSKDRHRQITIINMSLSIVTRHFVKIRGIPSRNQSQGNQSLLHLTIQVYPSSLSVKSQKNPKIIPKKH
jgi:hypothetical protein